MDFKCQSKKNWLQNPSAHLQSTAPGLGWRAGCAGRASNVLQPGRHLHTPLQAWLDCWAPGEWERGMEALAEEMGIKQDKLCSYYREEGPKAPGRQQDAACPWKYLGAGLSQGERVLVNTCKTSFCIWGLSPAAAQKADLEQQCVPATMNKSADSCLRHCPIPAPSSGQHQGLPALPRLLECSCSG